MHLILFQRGTGFLMISFSYRLAKWWSRRKEKLFGTQLRFEIANANARKARVAVSWRSDWGAGFERKIQLLITSGLRRKIFGWLSFSLLGYQNRKKMSKLKNLCATASRVKTTFKQANQPSQPADTHTTLMHRQCYCVVSHRLTDWLDGRSKANLKLRRISLA